jgi:hypothetical protein
VKLLLDGDRLMLPSASLCGVLEGNIEESSAESRLSHTSGVQVALFSLALVSSSLKWEQY